MVYRGITLWQGVETLQARLALQTYGFRRYVGLHGHGIIQRQEYHGIAGGGVHASGDTDHRVDILAQFQCGTQR